MKEHVFPYRVFHDDRMWAMFEDIDMAKMGYQSSIKTYFGTGIYREISIRDIDGNILESYVFS